MAAIRHDARATVQKAPRRGSKAAAKRATKTATAQLASPEPSSSSPADSQSDSERPADEACVSPARALTELFLDTSSPTAPPTPQVPAAPALFAQSGDADDGADSAWEGSDCCAPNPGYLCQTFMTNLTCCGASFGNLHELEQHKETCHVRSAFLHDYRLGLGGPVAPGPALHPDLAFPPGAFRRLPPASLAALPLPAQMAAAAARAAAGGAGGGAGWSYAAASAAAAAASGERLLHDLLALSQPFLPAPVDPAVDSGGSIPVDDREVQLAMHRLVVSGMLQPLGAVRPPEDGLDQAGQSVKPQAVKRARGRPRKKALSVPPLADPGSVVGDSATPGGPLASAAAPTISALPVTPPTPLPVSSS